MEWKWFFVLLCIMLNFKAMSAQKCNPADGTIAKLNPITIIKVPDPGLPTEYDSKGLQPFFNLAKSFMNTVQPNSFKELKGIDFDSITSDSNQEKIKDYELPILIAVGFGLLFAILMPIVGACFCCCRCCGNCGGNKSQDANAAKRHSCCSFMAILLMLVAVFMLCGVLFMFVTNNRLHEAVKDSSTTYQKGVDLALNYANATAGELRSVVEDQVPCIAELVTNDLGDHGVNELVAKPIFKLIYDNLANPITLAIGAAQNLSRLAVSLDEVSKSANQLKSLSTDMNNTISNIQTDIRTTTTYCYTSGAPSAACMELEAYGDKISSQTDYDSFPNIDNELQKVKDVNDKNLTGEIAVAQKTLDDIPQTVATQSKSQREDVVKTIGDMQKEVKVEVDKVDNDIDKEVLSQKSDLLKYKDDYLDTKSEDYKYEDYRYYAYIGLSVIMTLIVLLIMLGLTCGVCGYRKDRQPSHRTSIANHGGNMLMAAVGFMFLFSWLLMLFCVIWFFVGIHVHIACRDGKDGQVIDDLLDIKYEGDKISIKSLLENCRRNVPIYSAMEADRFFNVTDKLNVRKQAKDFDAMADKIKVDLSGETVLTTEAENALNDAQTTGVDAINFNQFFDTLKKSLTKSDLDAVIANMTQLADNIKTADATLYSQISAIISQIQTLRDGTIASIKSNLTAMEAQVKNLQSLSQDISGKAKEILDELKKSDNFVKNGAATEIKKIITDYINRLINWLTQGTDHLTDQVKNNMARCKPIADLYDGFFNTFVCDNVVQNANGFWLALGWCLLFFIPAMILCVRLAKYFRKMDYDTGHENSIDHPPYNDKIPLHSHNIDSQRSYSSTDDIVITALDDDNRTNGEEPKSYDNHMPPPYEPAGYQHQ